MNFRRPVHFRSTPTLITKQFKRWGKEENLSPRPFSHSENDGPELSHLLRLLECPVCREVPSPPIHNCVNGHFVCGSCRPRLHTQRCPYCLGSLTQMRNYPLESLVTTPTVSCDFVKFGCNVNKLSLLEYEQHVQQCWAQIWRPGKIIINSKSGHRKSYQPLSISEATENIQFTKCPRCHEVNSTRKVKCRNCDNSLRPPTPMKEVDFNLAF